MNSAFLSHLYDSMRKFFVSLTQWKWRDATCFIYPCSTVFASTEESYLTRSDGMIMEKSQPNITETPLSSQQSDVIIRTMHSKSPKLGVGKRR